MNQFIDAALNELDDRIQYETDMYVPHRTRHTTSLETRLTQFKEVHGSRYLYTKVREVSRTSRIVIGCPEHGDFSQVMDHHLRGHGCPACSRKNAAESNVLYIWQGEGTSLFKVGVTSTTQGKRRLFRVASKHSLRPYVWAYHIMNNPVSLERKLHQRLNGYLATGLLKEDGHTEIFEAPPSLIQGLISEFNLTCS